MSDLTYIEFEESPRDYRTEIPNIVFELLEAGDISPSDFILYSTYRRIAGSGGACWYGTRKLEKKCGLDAKTITKSKKNLSRPFEKLGGKSLIHITPCDRKKETADIIRILDIWQENHTFFKKSLGVGKNTTGVWENTPHKKEPIKKEPLIIAKPEEPPNPDDSMPAGGNNNSFKCLEKCTDLSPKQKRLLMKHPEPLVEQAIRYAYHPTTIIEGGPIGRIKLLQYFLKNPEDFKEKMESLDKPVTKQTKKDAILARFKRGKMYNGFEYLQDDIGIGFLKPGMLQPYSIRWDTMNFAAEFMKLLDKLGIKHDE